VEDHPRVIVSADEIRCQCRAIPDVTVGQWIDEMRRILSAFVAAEGIGDIEVLASGEETPLPRGHRIALGDILAIRVPASRRYASFNVWDADSEFAHEDGPRGGWYVYADTTGGRAVEDSLMCVVGITALAALSRGVVVNDAWYHGLTPEITPPAVWEDFIAAEVGVHPDLHAAAQRWHDRSTGPISERVADGIRRLVPKRD
jgi:hypothetical protein